MSEELKSTLKYLKNKNNTRRIKIITINEAYKVVEEIERLNNIINELEKRLYERWLEWKDSECESNFCMACEDKSILTMIKELKGSDEE